MSTQLHALMRILVVLLASGGFLRAADTPVTQTGDKEYASLRDEWRTCEKTYIEALDAAKTREARVAVGRTAPDPAAFADRFLKIAVAHPGTQAELCSLFWAALNATDTDSGRKAVATLTGGRIAGATPDELIDAIDLTGTQSMQTRLPLAAAALACAKGKLDDPGTPRLLGWVCVAYLGDSGVEPPPAFDEAATLIADRFAGHWDVSHFAEALYVGGTPAWGLRYEKHLRKLAAVNNRPLIKATSRFALASVVFAAGPERRAEGVKLLQDFVADFDGLTGPSSGIVSSLRDEALGKLQRLEKSAPGKAAPDIAGNDLDGKPMKLSDHRGKVVVLVFWFSACAPCLQDVPHERELAERFRGRPFVLLGVNMDRDNTEAVKAVNRVNIPWRSFRNADLKNSAASGYAVAAYPTVFVIDHTGVVRHDELRGDKLDGPLDKLVVEAEKAAKKVP